MNIVFSDICEKEVINCTDGSVLGYIADMEISSDDYRIIAITVRVTSGLFCKKEKIRITCDKIEKFGRDVIIVNYCNNLIQNNNCEKPKKHLFG